MQKFRQFYQQELSVFAVYFDARGCEHIPAVQGRYTTACKEAQRRTEATQKPVKAKALRNRYAVWVLKSQTGNTHWMSCESDIQCWFGASNLDLKR
jgi:hypothetical protein